MPKILDGTAAKSLISTLVTAAIIAQNGIKPILQFTTHDKNKIAIQGPMPIESII